MRRRSGVLALILTAGLVGLAVANRHPVTLYYDPLQNPDRAVELPVYAALLGALAVGVVLGGMASHLTRRRRHKVAARPAERHALPTQPLLSHQKGE